jgi:hypothetical protein
MAKLSYNDLPIVIKIQYEEKEIYKINKSSSTIISVYLKDFRKFNWRKRGRGWELLNASN